MTDLLALAGRLEKLSLRHRYYAGPRDVMLAELQPLLPFAAEAIRALYMLEHGGLLDQWGGGLPERVAIRRALALAEKLAEKGA